VPVLFTMNADISRFDVTGLSADLGVHIRFAVNGGPVLRVLESPRARLVYAQTVTGYIRSDGRMYDRPAVSAAPFDLTDPGSLGVRLLAAHSSVQANPLTYRVTLTYGDGTPITNWDTPAVPSSDTTVDLAAYAPAPTTF